MIFVVRFGIFMMALLGAKVAAQCPHGPRTICGVNQIGEFAHFNNRCELELQNSLNKMVFTETVLEKCFPASLACESVDGVFCAHSLDRNHTFLSLCDLRKANLENSTWTMFSRSSCEDVSSKHLRRRRRRRHPSCQKCASKTSTLPPTTKTTTTTTSTTTTTTPNPTTTTTVTPDCSTTTTTTPESQCSTTTTTTTTPKPHCSTTTTTETPETSTTQNTNCSPGHQGEILAHQYQANTLPLNRIVSVPSVLYHPQTAVFNPNIQRPSPLFYFKPQYPNHYYHTIPRVY